MSAPEQKFEYHPAANLFPLMDPESKEFKDLVENIRQKGQVEPAVLHDGKILDGRNRHEMVAIAMRLAKRPASPRGLSNGRIAWLATSLPWSDF
jgi:hypothetical protein